MDRTESAGRRRRQGLRRGVWGGRGGVRVKNRGWCVVEAWEKRSGSGTMGRNRGEIGGQSTLNPKFTLFTF